jgi:carbamoyl-phosphate synthase large subunit
MRDLTVLVTSAGNPGFVGALKGLRRNGERNIKIIAADCSSDAYGRLLADDFCIIPKASDPDYVPEIQWIIRRKKIDAVIPLSTPESIVLSERKGDLQALAMVSDAPQVRHSSNKFLLSFQAKQKIGIDPIDYAICSFKNIGGYASYLGYPKKVLCVKPIDGYGSRGFIILDDNANTINQYYNEKFTNRMSLKQFLCLFPGEDKEILIMKYVRGYEYTVDLLMRDQKVISGCVRRRDKVVGGISNQAIVVNRPDIIAWCSKIAEWFKLNYCIGVQLMEDGDGKLWPLEVNPRLQGTTILSIAAGLNCPYLGLKILLGEPFEIPKIKFGTKMARYWEEVFYREGKDELTGGSAAS